MYQITKYVPGVWDATYRQMNHHTDLQSNTHKYDKLSAVVKGVIGRHGSRYTAKSARLRDQTLYTAQRPRQEMGRTSEIRAETVSFRRLTFHTN